MLDHGGSPETPDRHVAEHDRALDVLARKRRGIALSDVNERCVQAAGRRRERVDAERNAVLLARQDGLDRTVRVHDGERAEGMVPAPAFVRKLLVPDARLGLVCCAQWSRFESRGLEPVANAILRREKAGIAGQPPELIHEDDRLVRRGCVERFVHRLVDALSTRGQVSAGIERRDSRRLGRRERERKDRRRCGSRPFHARPGQHVSPVSQPARRCGASGALRAHRGRAAC